MFVRGSPAGLVEEVCRCAHILQVLQLELRKPAGLQGEARLQPDGKVEARVSKHPEGIGYRIALFPGLPLSLQEG